MSGVSSVEGVSEVSEHVEQREEPLDNGQLTERNKLLSFNTDL